MDRRSILLAGGAAALAPALARAQSDVGAPDLLAAPDLKTLTRNAYIFTLPAFEVGRTRDRAFAAGAQANRFTHMRRLAAAGDRMVTTPNADTLYSTAFLDLRQGPVSLSVPETGRRYVSLALIDGWTNNFHIAGTRVDGGRAARLTVATAQQAAALKPADGTQVVVSPTRWVWALGRTLVDGPADLDAAHAVQDGITAEGAAGPPPPPAPPRDASAAALIGGAVPFLSDVGLLDADMGALMRVGMAAQRLGLSTAAAADPARVAEAQAGVDDAKALLRAGIAAGGRPVNGWTYPRPNLGDFGTDYLYRAAVALGGLATLPTAEAMYMTAAGDGAAGAPPFTFDGARAWRLDLPALPIDGFWSLTLYERTPEGALFFADNPLRRYAVGDRTPGLRRTADGGCSLLIGAADPGGERRANWLPAPAGRFTLILRAYLPRAELRDGRFRLPPVTAA